MCVVCVCVCVCVLLLLLLLLLWQIRGQKKDTEEEKVGWTSVLNKQKHIYKIRVFVQQVEVSVRKLSGSTAERKSLREEIELSFMKEEGFIIVQVLFTNPSAQGQFLSGV